MRRLNKNIVIFIITFSIIVAGLFSPDFLKGIYNSFRELTNFLLLDNSVTAFARFTDNVEMASSQGLLYHKDFVDLNSAVQKNMGTAIVYKDDMAVVRSKTGYLSYVRDEISKETLKHRAENVKELYKVAEKNGAEFMYVMAPAKGYNMEYPENII